MESKRGFKGVWIPKEIWLHPQLNITEKCLLVEIDSLDNHPERGCFASNEYLASFIGLSTGRTANIISDLRKRGFIEQCFFDGRNRGLRLHKNVKNLHENVKADFTEMLEQPSRKREHSNTENNTSINTEREGAREIEGPKVVIVDAKTLDWKEVAELLFHHSQNEGQSDWEYMKGATGYKGDGRAVFSGWAAKAGIWELANWKDNFPKLQTWMRNEARADLKNPQPEQPRRREVTAPRPQRERITPEEVEALREKYAVK